MLKKSLSKSDRKGFSTRRDGRSKRKNGNRSTFQSTSIQTRSIERVLAPIAAQVSQLIILNETAEREGGKLPNLIPFAQTVLRATEDLVHVGHRMARDTSDEKLEREMPEVCEASIAAGRSMLMAVQRLQAEPRSEAARDNMVTAARRLLEATMKVLLISDDAEVRRIIDACGWVMEGLHNIRAVASMKDLVASFKDFSESVLALCDLCDKRQQDLNDAEKREKILSALASLKRAAPLLNSAMQTYVKYPTNVQTKASRDYSCKLVAEAVGQIEGAVQPNTPSRGNKQPGHSADKPGHFAHNMEKLVERLSPNQRMKLDEDFLVLLEQTVKHGMSVAAASREQLKDEIVSVCKHILQLRAEVANYHDALEDNPSFSQLGADFTESCEGLAQDLLLLEGHVKSALIHQVVDNFTETTAPLDRLVKTATVRLKEKGPIKKAICERLLGPLDDSFHDHADKLLHMATFIAASCVDRNRGQEVLTLVANMEELDADVYPSCLAVRQDLTNKGALEHLKLVRREWHSCVQQLMDITDDLIDAKRFLEVTESCMEMDVDDCRQAGLISDADLLSEAANHLLGRCKRALLVARQHRDRHADAVYRNGLQFFIDQVENAAPLVKNGAHYAVGNMESKSGLTALLEHSRHLVQCVHELCTGLNAAHHPDILSPLRRGVAGRGARAPQDSADILRDFPPAEATPISQFSNPHHRKGYDHHQPPIDDDQDSPSKPFNYLSILDSTPSFHLAAHAVSTPLGAPSPLKNPSHLGRGAPLMATDPHRQERRPLSVKKITKDMIQKLEMAYPMNELVRGLFTKQKGRVSALCQMTTQKVHQYQSLLARTKKLDIDVEKTSGRRHYNICRLLEAKLTNLQQLTSDLTRQFESSLHGNDSEKADAVIQAEQWSSHMTEVVMEMMNLIGWSAGQSIMGGHTQTASDTNELQSQLDHVTSLKADLTRLISVVIGWKETLQSSDGGDTPTHAMHIQQMHSRASDWTTVTNSLRSLTNELLISEGDRELSDRAEVLSLEWWVGTRELLVTVDDIIFGKRSSEVITMETAIRTGQEAEVMAEVTELNTKSKVLKDQAKKAMACCADSTRQLSLTQAVKEMDGCTSSLATSSISMATSHGPAGTLEASFRLQRIGVLQREWTIKTRMVECLVEGLVIEGLIPLDRLTGTALAARQAQGASRQQLMDEFQAQAEGLGQAVGRVQRDLALLLQGVANLPERDVILGCTEALARITPAVVAKLRMIADMSSMSDNADLMNQKREWACNAKALIQAIEGLPGVDFHLKQELTRALLQDHSPPPSSASSVGYPSPRPTPRPASGVGGPASGFTPFTVPQLTPEQWRVLQSLPQHGIHVIQSPPGVASPYHLGNLPHHVTSGMTTPNQSSMTPRIVEPSPTPRPQAASAHDFSPGRLRSLHQSHLSDQNKSSSKKSSPETEGPTGVYRNRTLGLTDTPRSLKVKSASTSSLQSVNSVVVSDSGSVHYSNSITAAALALQQETDRWEEEKNEIIRVARVMATKMALLAKYARRHSCIEDKEELIATAKAIAAHGSVILKFADIIAANCVDQRFAAELRDEAQHIPTFSTQLDIIASVKAATPDDLTSNAALVKNAENLMTAVVKTLKAAEAACVKGLKSEGGGAGHPEDADPETQEAKALALQWRRKLHRHRLIQASTEDTDHLGLRKIKKNVSAPSLTEIVMR